jgi:predicted MFS family arabinose efflux permease
MVGAFLLCLPLVFTAEKAHKQKSVFLFGIFLLMLALSFMTQTYQNFNFLALDLLVFFIAFNLLEAMLPAWISRVAPKSAKGTAMGVYSSMQFLGIFTGGTLGGLSYAHYGIIGVFSFCVIHCFIWLVVASFARPLNPMIG